MFYVYEWFIVETGEIIYVGKGTRLRYKAKKKNKLLNKILELKKCDVRIIAYYETEEEAFEAERQRINELKDKGEAVCNKYSYTTGGVANIWTDEKREWMSKNNPMKDDKQKERMSKNNPMKNPEVAKRVGMSHRKAIFIGEKIYSYAKEAAEEYGVSETTIFTWAKNGVTKFGKSCGYFTTKGQEKSKHQISHVKLEHTIIYDGIEFNSTKEAAKYAGVKCTGTINRWCKNGYSPDGIPCRYKDDKTIYEYVPPNKSHGKRIICDGVEYSSIRDACEKLNVSDYVFRKHYNYTVIGRG